MMKGGACATTLTFNLLGTIMDLKKVAKIVGFFGAVCASIALAMNGQLVEAGGVFTAALSSANIGN